MILVRYLYGSYKDSIMVAEAVAELRTIKASRDLYNDERYVERLDVELERLISRLMKKDAVDRRDIKKTVDKYVASIGFLIEGLEKEKRRVLTEAENKLKELGELLKIEKGVNNQLISMKLHQIKNSIIRLVKQIQRGERRGTRGRTPLGYVMRKAAGRRRNLIESTRLLIRVVPRQRSEVQIFAQLKELIPRLSQEDKRDQVETEVVKLLGDYNRDIESILIIFVDFEIEEAERLHKISQYRTFLDMVSIKDYDQQLDNLVKRARIWVYQDFEESKRMNELVVMVEELIQKDAEIKKGSNDWDLSDIKETEYPINGVMGNLYMRGTKRNYTKGVVVSHGLGGTRYAINLFAKRLAKTGYLVYCVNMPGHGDSSDEFGLVRTCEVLSEAVRYLRLLGCKRVAYLTHSLSASASALAMVGYNQSIENEMYGLLERFFELDNKLSSALKNGVRSTEERTREIMTDYAEEDMRKLEQLQREIEQKIEESILKVRGEGKNADVMILLTPPKRAQTAVSPRMMKILRHLPLACSNMLAQIEKVDDMKQKSDRLKITDKDEFLERLINMKGVVDYFDLLFRFAKKSPRIRGLLDGRVSAIPKLVVFGGWDYIVRNPFRIKKSYKKLFGDLGNVSFSYHPTAGHIYSGYHALHPKRLINGMLKPYIARETLTFLKAHL